MFVVISFYLKDFEKSFINYLAPWQYVVDVSDQVPFFVLGLQGFSLQASKVVCLIPLGKIIKFIFSFLLRLLDCLEYN